MTLTVDEFQATYLWVFIVGIISAVLMAYGIGANDVANSFATSVGSKAMTFRQAVIVGIICETMGATFLGAVVAEKLRTGIFDMTTVEPNVLLLGIVCALFASGLWLMICTFFGLPVSTSHSIVGSIFGIGLSVNPSSIKWYSMMKIVISWLTSPFLSALLAAMFFLILRSSILRIPQGHLRALRSFPILLFVLLVSVAFSFMFKVPQPDLKKFVKANTLIACFAAVGISALTTGLIYAVTIKL